LGLAIGPLAHSDADPRVRTFGYRYAYKTSEGEITAEGMPAFCKGGVVSPSAILTALHCVLVFQARKPDAPDAVGDLYVHDGNRILPIKRAKPVVASYRRSDGTLDERSDLVLLYVDERVFNDYFEVESDLKLQSGGELEAPGKGKFSYASDLEVTASDVKTTARVVTAATPFMMFYGKKESLVPGDSGYPLVDPTTGKLVGIHIFSLKPNVISGGSLPKLDWVGVSLKLGPHAEVINRQISR